MKKKILIFGVLLAVTSVAAIAVAVKTTCGKWTYALSKDEYNALGDDGVSFSYTEYLMTINNAQCGEYVLPKVFEEVQM